MADARPPWRVLSSRSIVDDRWMKLDAERLETSRGTVLDPWYTVRGRAWACVVATIPDGRLVMVEQYRRGAGVWLLEIPAGDIDGAEDPAVAAMRELAEESGYRAAGSPTRLGAWLPEPAHSTARAHGFAVRAHAEPDPQRMDAGEDIVVRLLTLTEVESAIAEGTFCHGVQIGFWMRARAMGLA